MRKRLFKRKSKNEENNGGSSASSSFRLFLFMILTLSILLVASNAYLLQKNIDVLKLTPKEVIGAVRSGILSGNGTEIMNEIRFDPGVNASYNVYRDFIIEASKYGVRFLDKSGKEQYVYTFSMNRPLIKTNGTFVVIADIGGRDIYLFNGSQKVWNKLLDNSIVNFDISSKGYVVVVHEEARYKSAVTMFNVQGNIMFSLGKAENYIVFAKILPSGEQFILNELNASNVKIKSSLEFADIYGKFDEIQIHLEGTVITDVGHMNDGSISVIGDNIIKTFDKNGIEKWNAKVKGKIFGGNVCDSSYVVVARSFEESSGVFNNNKTSVEVYDDNVVRGTFNVEEQIKSVNSFVDTISVNGSNNVYFINTKGKLLGKFESKQEVVGMRFFDDSTALVIGKSVIYVVRIL